MAVCEAARVTFDLAVSDFERIDNQLVALTVASTEADLAAGRADPSGPGGPSGYVDTIFARKTAQNNVNAAQERRTAAETRRAVALTALTNCLNEPAALGVALRQ